jgi:tRNA threonylcarbamoyladenosine biosynthesis protein TsaE
LRARVHHFDLWRTDGSQALAELGSEEALLDIVLAEWPDLGDDVFPAQLDGVAIR